MDLKRLGEVKDVAKTRRDVESKIRKFKSYIAHYDLYSKIKKKCAEHGVKVVEGGFRKESV